MADTSEPSARMTPVTKTSLAKIPPVKPTPKRNFTQGSWHTRPRHGVKIDAILVSALEALQANRMRSFLTMLGVIIGVSAVIAVVSLTQGLGFPFVFSVVAIAVAFSDSAIVGISFGLYPAVRAAKLDPIVALRTE
jgi:hypothetical protein